MKLYIADRAPNPRRVLLFLAAKGLNPVDIGLEVIGINLSDSANRAPDYLRVHPLGQIPALELDDGQVITESMAICRYLEGKYPETPLLGDELMSQVWIDQYSRQAEIEILLPLMSAFQHGHPFWAGKYEQVPDVAPVARRRAQSRFSYFDHRLQAVPFLAGNNITAADLTLYAALDFGRLAGLKVDEQHPTLLRFYQRMHEQFKDVR
ncbi:glutathione S-transferase family protein [Aquirhabdus parva]|uniref:Glutathione S-transferase family protein n=1 Tax=Aquirhabdus parva TaxID=2283318 RepID=A0A345P5A1_9GAMM|nr:glutathione S-transferase family protein [Aquirhabdus parva]AXI02460.1 glutathione S-transferase family protein [Aquirhabdus parva]